MRDIVKNIEKTGFIGAEGGIKAGPRRKAGW